jgi:hypothetical protein
VALTIELTTPACPVKEMFQKQATQFVKVRTSLVPLTCFVCHAEHIHTALLHLQELGWVHDVEITMTAQPTKPLVPESGRPGADKGCILCANPWHVLLHSSVHTPLCHHEHAPKALCKPMAQPLQR